MERELRNAVEASVKNQVMDAIVGAHDELELPASLISQEINAMRQQMFQQFGGAAPQDRGAAHSCRERQFCLSLNLTIDGSIGAEKVNKAMP